MALVTQQRQFSLIDGNSLPHARVDIGVPNVAGALSQIGNSLIQSGGKKNADDEMAKKLADIDKANADVAAANMGLDASGHPVAVPPPNMSAAYQLTYHNGMQARFQTQFEAQVTEHLNTIQADENRPLSERMALMQSALKGAIETMPPQFRNMAGEWGASQLNQRNTLMTSQETNKQQRLTIDALSTDVGTNADKMASAEAAGLPPDLYREKMRSSLQRLVDMGAMPQEKADAQMTAYSSAAAAYGLASRIGNDLTAGGIDAQDLESFGVALNAGGDATITIHSGKGPGLHGNEVVTTKGLNTAITDPATREKLAGNLTLAARQKLQLDNQGKAAANAAANDEAQVEVASLKIEANALLSEITAAAAAGRPIDQPAAQFRATLQGLVKNKQFNQKAADIQYDKFISAAKASGIARQLGNDVEADRISASALERFGMALAHGGDAAVSEKAKPGDRDDRQANLRTVTTKEILDAIPDEADRRELGQHLATLGRQRQADIALYAKQNEMREWFTGATRTSVLPSAMRDDVDKQIQTAVDNGTLNLHSPEGRGAVLGMVRQGKYLPKAVVSDLQAALNTSDPQAFSEAMQFYHTLKSFENPEGDKVGEMAIGNLDKETVHKLDALWSAKQMGVSDAELMTASRAMNNPNAANMEQAIFDYDVGKTQGQDTFFATFREQWLAKTDVNAGSTLFSFQWRNGDETVPTAAYEEMKRAYHVGMLGTGNPKAAFKSAFDRVSQRWTPSPIFRGGWAETGIAGSLENPRDFATSNTIPGMGDPYEWANGFVKEALQNATTPGILPEDKAEVLNDASPLGKSVTLVPTDTNTDSPEFNVWMTVNGEQQMVMTEGQDGTMRALRINPHAVKGMMEMRYEKRETSKKLDDAAVGQIKSLRNLLQPIRGTVLGTSAPMISFDEFLTQQPAAVQERYKMDVDKIKEGLKKSHEDLDLQYPEATKGPIGDQSMYLPRANGRDVVAKAIATVEQILPDGTGGMFMARTAAQESNFGTAQGTFRASGDKGIWQVNTGSQGAFVEVKRRIATGSGAVYESAQLVKSRLKIDLSKATPADLDKPLISALFARLYYKTSPTPIPLDLRGQARLWKQYYNTVLGAGSDSQFVTNAAKANGIFGRVES